MDKNEVLGNINFINNFDQNEITFKNIFKFRKIFFAVLGNSSIESRKNSGIIDIMDIYKNEEYNMGFYNYTQNNISKALLDLLLNNNIDNNFIYKGNLIIKYLWDSFINLNNNNNNQKIIKKNNPIKKYDTNTYSGSLRYDKDEELFINNDNNERNFWNKSKIIEKHIDLKKGSKRKKPKMNLYNTNTYDINNNSQIYNNLNKTMSTSFSSKNLLKNINKNNLGSNKGIYLKKKCNLSSSNLINNNSNNKLNQTCFNIRSQFDLDNDEENTKINDSGINQGLNINMNINNSFKQKRNINNFGRANSSNYIYNTFNSQKNSDKAFNINSENKKEIITSKFIPEIKIKKIFNKNDPIPIPNTTKFNKENNNLSKKINSINININKGKTFKHKKLEQNIESNYNQNINPNSFTKEKEEENKVNQTQLYNKLNETSFQEDSFNNSNILNTTFNQAYSNNYYNIKKNIIISQKKQESNTNIQFITNNNVIKSSLFNNQLNNNISPKIQVRKNNYDTKYIINSTLPLCISLELDNDFCKICFMNQTNQEIEIFSFAEGSHFIPLIISFNEKNEIIIGQEAEQIMTLNPERTFFNLMKIFGKKFDEIIGMKELWPFKIYKDEKNRPFFWINLGTKDKKFFVEDLLSIYLRKLFKIFFKKIICEDNSDDNLININIILVISVPNNFTYFQRKALEKIFEKQIFPCESNKEKENNFYSNNSNSKDNGSNNSYNGIKLYNNYLINLKEIKIENVSSIAALCLKPPNNSNKNKINYNDIKPFNSLIINIGGAHTNISIASYPSYKNKTNNKSTSKRAYFCIKSITSIEIGSQDFTDTFVSDCLREFDNNLLRQCLETPSALAKLRKSCNTAEKIFKENSHVEIKVNKLYDTMNLKMILNKIDYEKVCDALYKKIILEIKKAIKEAKLSEINIENILLIGNISRSDKIKTLLKAMFKHNRLIFNQLSNNINASNDNNDYYSIIGGALQAKNYLFEEKLNLDNDTEDIFSLNDISPMSFGVETINGLMEFVIEKGSHIPIQKNKYIKIKNDGEKYLEIKIFEGEDNKASKNRLISAANIDKRNFKNEKVGNNYIEILIQFEISSELNLCVYVLDVKTKKRRFECLINIDVIKS